MSNPKHILITGCTRGLGKALIDSFIAVGHHVSGCGRSQEQIQLLKTAYPDRSHAFDSVDVTDAAAVEQWAQSVLSTNGAPDLLINNAAAINHPAPLWQVPRTEFSQLIDVNIKGVFNVIHFFLPAMIKRGSGIVVNLSSGWGRSTSPEVAPYCASKFAIEGLTQALAQELPPGLAAIPLNPGVIDTDMLRTCWADGAGDFEKPEEWARKAAPFILGLSANDNGKPLSV